MKKVNRGFALLVCFLFLVGMVLAGCSNSSDQAKPGETQPAASNTPDNKSVDWKTVKADIRFVFPGTSEAEKELAEQFKTKMKEKYPNINIEYMFLSWQDMEKKLAVMINSGDVPDMTMTQDITNLVQLGGLEDLTPYMERSDSTVKKDNFLPGTLDYSVIDGKAYSVPAMANSFSLMVNEKMLNDAGMKLEDLKTYADVEKAAKLMTKDGKFGYGYPLGVARFAFRVPFTAAYSNDLLLSDTSDGSKKKYMEVLEHFKNLEPYEPKAQLTWGYPEMFRAFSNGEIGMIPAGTFFSANVYSINPEIINVTRAIAYPQGPSGKAPKAPVSNGGFGIFKDSKNKDVAWKLIEELLTTDFNSLQAAAVNVTALKGTNLDEVVKKAEKVYPKAIEGHKRLLNDFNSLLAQRGVLMDRIVGQPEMETIVQENMAKLLTDKINTEEAYKAIKDGIDKVKAKYNK